MGSDLARAINARMQSPLAVLYGGTSAEREVSLSSGQFCYDALVSGGIETVLVDTRDDWMRIMREGGLVHAFIALHGPGGEDGTIQGALATMGISFTGSGVLASALAMDKWRSKQMWRGMGLPTPEFARLTAESDWDAVLAALSGKAMVKPAHEGSSIGMTVVDSAAQLQQAYHTAAVYDSLVFAERWLGGGEYTVAIVAGETLPAIRLETDRTFYDYDAKYLADDTRYLIPCGLSAQEESELKSLCVEAYQSLGCAGWGRADVLRDDQGQFQVLEVNTVPGMTDHSLVPMAAKAAGYSFEELVLRILAASLELQPSLREVDHGL